MISEFTYGEAGYVTNSVYHQPIMYDGEEVGVLRTSDINLLAPLVETYLIPDVEAGLDEGGAGLLPGKLGWFHFKCFSDYNEALAYVQNNLDKILYLLEYGDYD